MKKLNLIQNKYTKSEAKEVLTELYRSKIKFNQSRAFSNEERYGDDRGAKKRVQELKYELENLEQYLNTLDDESILRINSDVRIEEISTLDSKLVKVDSEETRKILEQCIGDLSKMKWVDDNTVDLTGSSALDLHSFTLKMEEIGKSINYKKETLITVS